MTSGCGDFLKIRGNIQTVPELKESITRHISSIDQEILRAIVKRDRTRFEHVIDINGMHKKEICD